MTDSQCFRVDTILNQRDTKWKLCSIKISILWWSVSCKSQSNPSPKELRFLQGYQQLLWPFRVCFPCQASRWLICRGFEVNTAQMLRYCLNSRTASCWSVMDHFLSFQTWNLAPHDANRESKTSSINHFHSALLQTQDVFNNQHEMTGIVNCQSRRAGGDSQWQN